jgi:superfamily II DNA/RNA helicase
MAHMAREHVAKVFAKSADPIQDIVDFVHGIANDKCGLDHNCITLELFGDLTPQDKCGRTAIFCNAPTIDNNICRRAQALVATNLASVGLDNKKIALVIHDGLPPNFPRNGPNGTWRF